MTKKEQSVIETEVKNLAVAVENLTYQIEILTGKLQGDGGHTIGDSLEAIMLHLLKQKK